MADLLVVTRATPRLVFFQTVLDNIIVQRTLVFNTGSGLGDGLPVAVPPAKGEDDLEKSESKQDQKDASKTSVHSGGKAEEPKK